MDAYADPVAVDTNMLMCLVANSVATVAVVVILNYWNRRQSQKEEEWRYLKLCERIERERAGWAGEREAIARRVEELETRVLAYQKELASQYRAQVYGKRSYPLEPGRIDSFAYDAAPPPRLNEWRSRDPGNPPSGVSLPDRPLSPRTPRETRALFS
ncbi:hypothetical protein DIPPA_34644 [Diplonema papillatum]|nr:hypothetical protein DIPPA_34644 [Diplonema papillatum]